MESKTDNSNEIPKANKSAQNFFKSPIHLLILVLLLLVGIAAVYKFNSSDSNTTNQASSVNNTNTDSGVKMYLSPSAQKLTIGDTLEVSVWADSEDQEVNAVQAYLSYPVEKLELKNIDSTNSAYEIKAEEDTDNGKINIVRGHVGELSGRQLVAVIKFEALDSPGTAVVSFLDGSRLVTAEDNKDILQKTTDGTFSLEAKQ